MVGDSEDAQSDLLDGVRGEVYQDVFRSASPVILDAFRITGWEAEVIQRHFRMEAEISRASSYNYQIPGETCRTWVEEQWDMIVTWLKPSRPLNRCE